MNRTKMDVSLTTVNVSFCNLLCFDKVNVFSCQMHDNFFENCMCLYFVEKKKGYRRDLNKRIR